MCEVKEIRDLAHHMGGCQNDGPFWVLIIVRHLLFRVHKKGP